MTVRKVGVFTIALASLMLLPAAAHAQSAIAGVVKDASDAVLPGVTVQAASPALIEKVRTVVTDERGIYQIVDLRPGTYTITFTLTGFNTFRREDLELPSDFTATVNAELRLGALEETVTVTGTSPIVDVQSTAKTQVLSREMLDALPSGRTAGSFGQLIPGVTIGTPDVGGSRAMQQAAYNLRGNTAKETTVMLDGIQLNGMCGDGSTQAYTNTQSYEEIVFQTSGAGADVSSPGVRQNMIPRQGGNEFHGSFAGVGSRPGWQSADSTPELRARGLQRGSSLHGVSDFEGGTGGRFIRDRLWWFSAARRITANEAIPDTFYPDGSPGINNSSVRNLSLRLTWQLTQNNRFTGYTDRVSKRQSNADMVAGDDPVASELWPPSKLYAQSQVKWTSTLSNRFLLEIGAAQYQAYYIIQYQPEARAPYGSPEWDATVAHIDTARGTRWEASPDGEYELMNPRRFLSAIASYVTGSHNFRFGVQEQFGFYQQGFILNGALHQIYQNGVPTAVAIHNTPVKPRFNMKSNLGVFGQDSWTIGRMTVNAGLRWDYFSAEIARQESGEGRFVPLRTFGPEQMPVWKTLSPRFGVTYDLFGNAKTALKFSANRYQLSATDGVANDYNPMRLQSSGNTAVSWTDLNRDDIAQGARGCVYLTPGCEINFAQLPANFGLITPGCQVVYAPGSIPCGLDQVDPNHERDNEWVYSAGVQHELLPRVSVTANWFYTRFYNLRLTQNILHTFADYTPVQVASPLDGRVVTIYNVSAAKQNQVLRLNSSDPEARRWNHTLELGFAARFAGGASLFGGTATDRTIRVQCGYTDNPNNLEFCDQSQSGIPWNTQFKLAGSIPLPGGVQAGASFSTYKYTLTNGTTPLQGAVIWQVGRTTRYPADCKGPCTPGALVNPGQTVTTFNVPLAAPGTQLSDRIKQLDLNVGRWFTLGRTRFQPEVSLFNVLNNRAAYNVRSLNYLTTSFMQPSAVLQPRLLRIGVQVRW
jgi:hypothetical protein